FHAVSPFCCRLRLLLSFLFTDSPPSEIYTLSLHDALPILAALMADFQEQIGTVVFGQGMQFQLEHSSGSQVGQVALSPSYIRRQDRKSTRLNSSHVKISYAVFCLKKKKNRLTANGQDAIQT